MALAEDICKDCRYKLSKVLVPVVEVLRPPAELGRLDARKELAVVDRDEDVTVLSCNLLTKPKMTFLPCV